MCKYYSRSSAANTYMGKKRAVCLEKPAEFIINLTGADCACRYVMLLGSKAIFFSSPLPPTLSQPTTPPLQFPLVPLFARSGYRSRYRALIQPELLEIPVFINFRPTGATGAITRLGKHFRSVAYYAYRAAHFRS